MPTDQGAEQGDVDILLECSLAVGTVAAETRERVAAQQASGSLPWTGVDGLQTSSAYKPITPDCRNRQLPAGWPSEIHWSNDRAVQKNLWYMDDGATQSTLPTPKLEQSGNRSHRLRERPGCKPLDWRTKNVKNMAKVSTVTTGSITLRVAVGPRQFIADQLLAKADVIRAMHERVQLCQDPQTEFALLRSRPHDLVGATSR